MGERGPKLNQFRGKMTPERRQAFLTAFRASGGVWAAACRMIAHPDSPAPLDSKWPPAMSSFRALARRDPEFGAAVEEVLQACRDDVEAEIHRRGQVGYTDNVYQKGEQVFNRDGTPAVVHRYSDNLLLARAKAMMPDRYSERKNIEHSGHITHGMAGHLTIASADLAALDPVQRGQLQGILGTIQEARRDGGDVPALTYEPAEEILDADFEEVELTDAEPEAAIPY